MRLPASKSDCGHRRQERGLVTVILLILVILASLYVAVNLRLLATLRDEGELSERRHCVSDRCQPEVAP